MPLPNDKMLALSAAVGKWCFIAGMSTGFDLSQHIMGLDKPVDSDDVVDVMVNLSESFGGLVEERLKAHGDDPRLIQDLMVMRARELLEEAKINLGN